MTNIHPQPSNLLTDENDWWFIFNEDSRLVFIKPQQCSGCTSSPHTMVVADTLEECMAYIAQHGLLLPPEPDTLMELPTIEAE